MKLKHVNAAECPLCNEKLQQVDAELAKFVRLVRAAHPDAHISWGHRGKTDQELFFVKGTSKAHFGESAHNVIPSMAVDFFRLTQAGGATFDMPWYSRVIGPMARAAGMVWGGDWKTFREGPHVEKPGFVKFKG